MKKSLLVLAVLVLGFFINTDLTSATVSDADADYFGCAPGALFSSTTGKPCNLSNNDLDIRGYAFSTNLSIGSRGNDVKVLQSILKESGYFFGKVDGKYGRVTGRALGDMQEDYDLPITEKLDSATRAFFLARAASDSSVFNIVTPTRLPNAKIGIYYAKNIEASGMESYYEWSMTSGSLPPGIEFHPSSCGIETCGTTGTLSGSPTVPGTYNFTVRIRTGSGPLNDGSKSFSKQFTLVVDDMNSGVLSITTIPPLPTANAGAIYNAYLYASTGFSQYNWSITSGSLPNGLTFTASDNCGVSMNYLTGQPGHPECILISGTPYYTGTYTFTAKVTTTNQNGIQMSATKQFTISVGTEFAPQSPTIISILPAGCSSTSGWSSVTGGSCSGSRSSANSGDTIYLYGSGFSPSNSVFLTDTDGGRIGFPTTYVSPVLLRFTLTPSVAGITFAPGAYIFQVMKSQDGPTYYSNGIGMDINSFQSSQLIIVTPSSLSNAKVGNPYTATLNVLPSSVFTNQLNWSVMSGSLPSGLSLSASDKGEIITGTPTTAGTYSFTLSASLSTPSTSSGTTSKQFNLVVDPNDSVDLGSIVVKSPTGGTDWVRPSKQTIDWSDRVVQRCAVGFVCPSPKYDLTLTQYRASCPDKCPVLESYSLGTVSSTSYTWDVGSTQSSNVPDGKYTIKVCRTGTDMCGFSSSYFTIFTIPVPVIVGEITVSRHSASPYGSIYTGTQGAELFRINISAKNLNATIRQLNFNLNGNATRYISNIKAYVDGSVVGSLSNLVNTDAWYFTGTISTSGLTIPVGSSKAVSIRGDIASDVWSTRSACPGCTENMSMILNDVVADDKNTVIGLPVVGHEIYIPYETVWAKNNVGSMLGANALGATTPLEKNNTQIIETPKPSNAKFHFVRYMELGSYGAEVMELQKILAARGYYTATIDLSFGKVLKEALARFQKDNGMKADGIFGYEVRTFLNK